MTDSLSRPVGEQRGTADMVWLAGGEFTMGSGRYYSAERPRLCEENNCQRYRPAARIPQMIESSTSHIVPGFEEVEDPKIFTEGIAPAYQGPVSIAHDLDHF